MFPGGEVLGIVEGNDLRPAGAEQILLKTRRDIDGGDRPPRTNGPGGALQILRALGDTQPRRRRDRLYEFGRNVRAVGVDNDYVETPHDRAAERPGQNNKRD